MLNKKLQRKYCKINIASLSEEYKQSASDIIVSKLKEIIKDEKVLSFYPTESEVNILPFNSENKAAYPVIKSDGLMDFYYSANDSYTINTYGIKEPNILYSELINPENYKYILVPMLGFDSKLNRLGHGGAYYDRYLLDKELIKIGVCFDIQKLDNVVFETHDIKMDYIITEKEIYK